MAAVTRVYTLPLAAEMLGEDAELLWEVYINTEPEDGCLWLYGSNEQQIPAFTDCGIESLADFIREHKANRADGKTATDKQPGHDRALTIQGSMQPPKVAVCVVKQIIDVRSFNATLYAGGSRMEVHAGGCLCGSMRYATRGQPARVTVCHCRFCQRATGSAYMVEPIFERSALEITVGEPANFELQSAGHGKKVCIHFCPNCGTKLFLTFERFPCACGIYAGTYDDPHRFCIEPETFKHIFISMARPDSLVPAGLPVYADHASTNEGIPHKPVVLERSAGARDCLMSFRAA